MLRSDHTRGPAQSVQRSPVATIVIADDTAGVRRLLHLVFAAHHTLVDAEDGWQAMCVQALLRAKPAAAELAGRSRR
jgi:hypothetical protein